MKLFLQTPLKGAQTTLYCLLEPSLVGESGGYYRNCKEEEPHERAMGTASQLRLWQISEEMVGL